MTQQEYVELLHTRFGQSSYNPVLQAEEFYEEQFELKWLATKLKQFSFVAEVSHISAESLQAYSKRCLEYALQECKGLPRGIQNGVVSYNVLLSEYIEKEAISFAMARPKIHFAAFEMPVIVDLSTQGIYCYQETPIWGSIYYKHFREYIARYFSPSASPRL